MDKTFSPSYSSSQITYVEAEAVGFSRLRFHWKRTASTASASTSLVATRKIHKQPYARSFLAENVAKNLGV